MRALKHEEFYVKDYRAAREARESIARCFESYNEQRLHPG